MLIGTSLSLLIGLGVIAHARNDQSYGAVSVSTLNSKCSVTGNWTNELGSVMELTAVPDFEVQGSGCLSGQYNTKVGHATGVYPINGRYTVINTDCVLGFSVSWNNIKFGNSQSTTSWTGVYYSSLDAISTFWILTSHHKPQDMWKNSQIGNDVFKKN